MQDIPLFKLEHDLQKTKRALPTNLIALLVFAFGFWLLEQRISIHWMLKATILGAAAFSLMCEIITFLHLKRKIRLKTR